jgi:hypothetical protein
MFCRWQHGTIPARARRCSAAEYSLWFERLTYEVSIKFNDLEHIIYTFQLNGGSCARAIDYGSCYVINNCGILQLNKALGSYGLTALDKLYSFMIVKQLENV